MRTRQRRQVIVSNPGWSNLAGTWKGLTCANTPIADGGANISYGPFAQEYLDELITDVEGPKLPLKTKPVWHRKKHVTIHNVTSLGTIPWTVGYSSYETGTQWLEGPAAAVIGFYHALPEAVIYDTWDLDGSVVLPPPGLTLSSYSKSDNALISDVHDKASQLQADILLNICESGQLLPSVRALTTNLSKVNYAKLRAIGAAAAGATLAWKFGLSPLLGDIQRTIKSSKDIQRKLQQFRDGKTLRYSATAKAGFAMDPNYALVQDLNYSVYTRRWKRSFRVLDDPVRRVVLRVAPNRALVDSLIGDISFFVTRYSTSLSKLAWELTPWSFVVDWFVDVRGILRKIDQILGFRPYEVKSMSISSKYRVLVETYQANLSACSLGTTIGGGTTASCDYSHYERQPISDRFMPEWRNRFGKNQYAVSAALITQILTGSMR